MVTIMWKTLPIMLYGKLHNLHGSMDLPHVCAILVTPDKLVVAVPGGGFLFPRRPLPRPPCPEWECL